MTDIQHSFQSNRFAPTERRVRRGPALSEVSEDFSAQVYASGLDYGQDHDGLIQTFLAALATKPFVILSGLSGSGKTRLAMALGQWLGKERSLLYPVRPDWDTPEAILGNPNFTSETSDALHAWSVPRSLEFILAAARNPDEPYLLVLEEMNLAHVEQYFADVLSGMESGHPIVPNLVHDGTAWRLPRREIPYIPWPKNLLVVGTVNIDETTYEFSPKVLDRATNIEFRVLPGSLRADYPQAVPIEKARPALTRGFLSICTGEDPEWNDRAHLSHNLQHLHRLLFEFDGEFGHRVFRESLRFGALLADAGCVDPRDLLDYVTNCKILVKLENSKMRRMDLIRALSGFALYGSGRVDMVDPREQVPNSPLLPKSFSKLRRLARSLD